MRIPRRAALVAVSVAVATQMAVPSPASAASKTIKDPKGDPVSIETGEPSAFSVGDLRQMKTTVGKKRIEFELRLDDLTTTWTSFIVLVKPPKSGDVHIQLTFETATGVVVRRHAGLLDPAPDLLGRGTAMLEYGSVDAVTLSAPRSWFTASDADGSPAKVRVNAVVVSTVSDELYGDMLIGDYPDLVNPVVEWSDWIEAAK